MLLTLIRVLLFQRTAPSLSVPRQLRGHSSLVLVRLLLVMDSVNLETQSMSTSHQTVLQSLLMRLTFLLTMLVSPQSQPWVQLPQVFGMAQMLLLQMVVLVLLMQPLLVQTLVSRQLLVRLLQAPQLLLVLPLKAIRHTCLELLQQPLSTISIQLT